MSSTHARLRQTIKGMTLNPPPNTLATLVTMKQLLKDVKKFDDKLLQIELQLAECQVQLVLRNIIAAKSALTGARAASHSVYTPPELQSRIDMLSGIISTEESDYRTAYSYFYEAYESYNSIDKSEEAIRSLKYMVLAKILSGKAEDVDGVVASPMGRKFATHLVAMKAVADAYKNRSLQEFEKARRQHAAALDVDPFIGTRVHELEEQMFEKNVLRVVEPYSKVQVSHVARLMERPHNSVEAKLAEMILDKQINGILDQGTGCLILYSDVEKDKSYDTALETIKELGDVVDLLHLRAEKLHE